MMKRKLVRAFVRWSDGWNREFHEAIEAKVHAEYKNSFPADRDIEEVAKTIEGMRSFYYSRMSATAGLLVAIVSLVVSLASLLVSLIALAAAFK
nr:hypothetical protein [uncultured Cupriavidus sp.]